MKAGKECMIEWRSECVAEGKKEGGGREREGVYECDGAVRVEGKGAYV